MGFQFAKMNKDYAEEMAYQWKYEGMYKFYDMTADKDDLKEFLDSNNWEYKFAVLNQEEELVGFFSYNFQDEIMWIGFGLKPEYTGKSLGYNFVQSGIEFGLEEYKYKKDYIMLAVAEFNKRAIKLYEKLGFNTTEKYMQETNGGEYKFLKMKKRLKSY